MSWAFPPNITSLPSAIVANSSRPPDSKRRQPLPPTEVLHALLDFVRVPHWTTSERSRLQATSSALLSYTRVQRNFARIVARKRSREREELYEALFREAKACVDPAYGDPTFVRPQDHVNANAENIPPDFLVVTFPNVQGGHPAVLLRVSYPMRGGGLTWWDFGMLRQHLMNTIPELLNGNPDDFDLYRIGYITNEAPLPAPELLGQADNVVLDGVHNHSAIALWVHGQAPNPIQPQFRAAVRAAGFGGHVTATYSEVLRRGLPGNGGNIVVIAEGGLGGSFGVAHKARCKHTAGLVALKHIFMDQEREDFPITALREIKMLQKLKHENITELLEIFTKKRHGTSVTARGRFNFYLVFTTFCAHDLAGLLSNVLHRDMKTANVLISHDGD